MRRFVATAFTASVLWAGASVAAPITPTSDFIGSLPPDSFTGDGIPTDRTAITEFEGIGGDLVTLGISATPRFENPSFSDDDAGTFFPTVGSNDGTPGSNTGTIGATWNFSFFINVLDQGGGSDLYDYDFELLYDLDAGFGTDEAALGRFVVNDFEGFEGQPGAPQTANSFAGSQNANFGFLATGVPGFTGIVPPSGSPSFDPNETGEYTFAIRSLSESEISSINVNVSAVPVPAAAVLLISALGLLGFARRRS